MFDLNAVKLRRQIPDDQGPVFITKLSLFRLGLPAQLIYALDQLFKFHIVITFDA